MNTVYKTKSQVRQETEDAVTKFLRSGGSIQEVPAKKTRKRTTQKMSGKTSRGFQGSTPPRGYTRSI